MDRRRRRPLGTVRQRWPIEQVGLVKPPSPLPPSEIHRSTSMNTVYKIHPAVGIGRLGNHPTSFFIGPESFGSPGVEIGNGGAESPLSAYKDAGRIKRQAARFRVFEYEEAEDGTLRLRGEVPEGTRIDWTVDLANRKAALDRQLGPARPRNVDVADRHSLVIQGLQPVTI